MLLASWRGEFIAYGIVALAIGLVMFLLTLPKVLRELRIEKALSSAIANGNVDEAKELLGRLEEIRQVDIQKAREVTAKMVKDEASPYKKEELEETLRNHIAWQDESLAEWRSEIEEAVRGGKD